MGAASRRSSTLEAAEDHLEMLDLSRSISARRRLRRRMCASRAAAINSAPIALCRTRAGRKCIARRGILSKRSASWPAPGERSDAPGADDQPLCFRHGDGRTTSFAELLYQIHEAVPDLPRLRFVTSFPRDFTDEALTAMRDCRRICRYLHVPVQSGSDRILKMMNRGYTAGAIPRFYRPRPRR